MGLLREDDIDVEVSASGFTRQMEKDLSAELGHEEREDEEEECEEGEEDIDTLRQKVEQLMSEEDNGKLKLQIGDEGSHNVKNETKHLLARENTPNISSNFDTKSNGFNDARSIRSTSTAATIAPGAIKKRVKMSLERREQIGVGEETTRCESGFKLFGSEPSLIKCLDDDFCHDTRLIPINCFQPVAGSLRMKVKIRGTVPAFAWSEESATVLEEKKLRYPSIGPQSPSLGGLVQHESDGSDHAVTEAGLSIRPC
uniref:(California timema) hypothetical protein n=1 Tax=Timema californicum TaxID=61474 RepID=A0A7R9P960_TIMCA|nr:unnamed protein product [Timema californicum]